MTCLKSVLNLFLEVKRSSAFIAHARHWGSFSSGCLKEVLSFLFLSTSTDQKVCCLSLIHPFNWCLFGIYLLECKQKWYQVLSLPFKIKFLYEGLFLVNFQAKFSASLFWLVFHATKDGGLEDVPDAVTSPIQRFDKVCWNFTLTIG